MIVRDILNESTKALEAAQIPSARLDAEVLLAFCLGCDRLEFLKNPERRLDPAQRAAFDKLISRRLRWEPVAYITGRKAFWTFTLEVSNDVLIPRPDTEVIVEEMLQIAKKSDAARIKILEIGTGSGAIAIAVASEIPHASITATDISFAALNVARRNAESLGLQNQIDFRQGDLFEPVEGVFDIIASNPPYIGAQEYQELSDGVRSFEPREALFAGESGLEFYEKLIYQAQCHLEKNGWLLLEIGARQEKDVCRIMEASGFYDHIEMRRDYAGLPRVIRARRKVSG
ncbi:MAG: peptide chain release factor N(5)-glutamine methyltransferase [Deltaproteobacteria bacterium HGW-Deltaproteobacteria-13]|nr:MAG: peptide chain release factor N(5)-glutamine methyltransferase [Deltaproteobacteria bacterium HGW-Deltaproteobacteria-13]